MLHIVYIIVNEISDKVSSIILEKGEPKVTESISLDELDPLEVERIARLKADKIRRYIEVTLILGWFLYAY